MILQDLFENGDQAAVDALQKKHGWSMGQTVNGDLYFTWQGLTYEFYGERVRINWPNGQSVSVVWGKKPDWQGRGNDEVSFAQAVQQKLLKFDLSIWQQLDRRQINDNQALQKFKAENERQAREAIAQGVTEGSLEELANTSLKVKQPKNFVNVNDRKQVTYKVMKFKSGKDTYLINFTVKGAPAYGKKLNWNAVNVAFGVREEQDDYSFGDEINTDLTAQNKNQFLIYSTVINAIRKFITEYNTEIDEIIMQGAGERQAVMYQRFFQSAGKYFPGWHSSGKQSLVRDVPRQPAKQVREQGVEEGLLGEADASAVQFRTASTDNYQSSFTVTAIADGKNVGHFSFFRDPETDDVHNQAEVTDDVRGKGYGKALLLKAIEVANDHGLGFQEDSQSLSRAQSRVYDSLYDAGWIVDADGYWFLTPEGEQELARLSTIQQGVAESREKFNDEIMQPGFRWSEDINGITYLVRTRWDNMPEVVARVNNREVGRATFINHHTRSGLESVSTYVSPKWQGWGIAKNMYAVMRMLGANIQPSATQTAMGKDMWAKWKKGGDTKHLTSMNAKIDEQGVTEFAPAANDDNDKKAYLLQLAQALGDAMYGPNKNKQVVLDIKSKIVDAGGDVKILWNDDGTFNLVMYHPTYFKQGYLIRLVGGQGPALSENNKVKPIAQPKQHIHVPTKKKITPAAIIHIKQKAITEGLTHPVICVDVQPEYNGGPWPPANPKFVQIMNFVQKQTGPVLFFINAEDQGLSGDSVQQIQQFWDETLGTEGEEGEDENGEYYYNEPESPVDWRRFEIVDKGYGYLRSWMDHGIEPSIIIATIREMYAQKVSDTRDLEFPAFNRRTTTQSLIQGAIEEMQDDPLTVGWASVAQLKRFNGAYLVGGGRDECLREVELLMNAFNIKYKRIDSLVY